MYIDRQMGFGGFINWNQLETMAGEQLLQWPLHMSHTPRPHLSVDQLCCLLNYNVFYAHRDPLRIPILPHRIEI